MGAPKATDIPAAEAADRISRFLAKNQYALSGEDESGAVGGERGRGGVGTFVCAEGFEEFDEEVCAATGDVDKWSFLSEP
jgi:hypothetical protein